MDYSYDYNLIDKSNTQKSKNFSVFTEIILTTYVHLQNQISWFQWKLYLISNLYMIKISNPYSQLQFTPIIFG